MIPIFPKENPRRRRISYFVCNLTQPITAEFFCSLRLSSCYNDDIGKSFAIQLILFHI